MRSLLCRGVLCEHRSRTVLAHSGFPVKALLFVTDCDGGSSRCGAPLCRRVKFDVVVVGSGPNGMSAAVALASWGYSVCLLEGADRVGGGLRSHSELEAGFIHDHCAAIHPMGVLSPFLQTLGLEEEGLVWKSSEVSVAHPLLDGPAAVLCRDFSKVRERLGERDGEVWRRLFQPWVQQGQRFVAELLGPPTLFPRHPWSLLRFAWHGIQGAQRFAAGRFQSSPAQALFAGLAGHSILPLERAPSAALGLVFGLAGHLRAWPCVEGGSERLAQALLSKFSSLGGEVRTGTWIRTHAELPPHRVALYDVCPEALAQIAAGYLPPSYKRRLRRYRMGPGTYKLDYTLDGPIPWNDPVVNDASTVHIGASLHEIAESERAVFDQKVSERPYLIVCQQSALDPSRAPATKHTGYAYCHVPHGFTGNVTESIERQLERFAPGFRDIVRERRVTTPKDLERSNPNLVGGVVAGGVADLGQLFTRPVARLNPYTTPNPRIFLCSASTPPGGGVHGMCGYYAARSALRRLQ